MKKTDLRYLLVLIGMCGLVASSVGIITNVAGLFFTPISEEFNVLKGSVSMTLTIANLCFALGGLAAPRLFNEANLRKVLVIGTACIVVPTAAQGLSHSIALMYPLNAVRGFAGGVLGFVLVTTVINNWFHSSVGLATSIAMSFSGLTGALMSPLLSSVIQNAGWRAGCFAAAAIILMFNLPAILFLPSLDPRSKGFLPYGYTGEVNDEKEKTGGSRLSGVSGILFAAVLVYAFMSCAGTALPQHFPGIAGFYGLSASAGAMMLSVCMIVNSIGKIILGAMADRFGAKISMLVYSVLTASGILILLFIHIPSAMYAGACLYGLIYSLGTVAVVMLTKDMFGLENYGRTYPVISLVGTVGTALMSSVIGFMYDFSGNYTGTLTMMLAMVAVNTMIILVSYRYRKA